MRRGDAEGQDQLSSTGSRVYDHDKFGCFLEYRWTVELEAVAAFACKAECTTVAQDLVVIVDL